MSPSFTFADECSGASCHFCGPIDPFARGQYSARDKLGPEPIGCLCCGLPLVGEGAEAMCQCGWTAGADLRTHYATCSGQPLPF